MTVTNWAYINAERTLRRTNDEMQALKAEVNKLKEENAKLRRLLKETKK